MRFLYMVAVKGQVLNPKGRGNVPNKATMKAREAIAAFVDNNAHRLNRLLDKIEAENPKAAFDAIMSVVEYHIPKLSRAEVEQKIDVTNQSAIVNITFVAPDKAMHEEMKTIEHQPQEPIAQEPLNVVLDNVTEAEVIETKG